MARLLELLGVVWLPVVLLVAGLALLAVGLRRRSEGTAGAWRWLVPGGAALAAGLGGVTLPDDAGFWIALSAGLLFFVKLVLLVITGYWLVPLAAGLAAVTLFGLGGWLGRDLGGNLVFGART